MLASCGVFTHAGTATVDILTSSSRSTEAPYLLGTVDSSLGLLTNLSLSNIGARDAFIDGISAIAGYRSPIRYPGHSTMASYFDVNKGSFTSTPPEYSTFYQNATKQVDGFGPGAFSLDNYMKLGRVGGDSLSLQYDYHYKFQVFSVGLDTDINQTLAVAGSRFNSSKYGVPEFKFEICPGVLPTCAGLPSILARAAPTAVAIRKKFTKAKVGIKLSFAQTTDGGVDPLAQIFPPDFGVCGRALESADGKEFDAVALDAPVLSKDILEGQG
jgi:hypothetical protein